MTNRHLAHRIHLSRRKHLPCTGKRPFRRGRMARAAPHQHYWTGPHKSAPCVWCGKTREEVSVEEGDGNEHT